MFRSNRRGTWTRGISSRGSRAVRATPQHGHSCGQVAWSISQISSRGNRAARATPQHGHSGGQVAWSISQHSNSGTILIISGSQIPPAELRALLRKEYTAPAPGSGPPSGIEGPPVATPPTALGTKSTRLTPSKGGRDQNLVSWRNDTGSSDSKRGHGFPNAPHTVQAQASASNASPHQAAAPITAPAQTPGDNLMGPGPTNVSPPGGEVSSSRNTDLHLIAPHKAPHQAPRHAYNSRPRVQGSLPPTLATLQHSGGGGISRAEGVSVTHTGVSSKFETGDRANKGNSVPSSITET